MKNQDPIPSKHSGMGSILYQGGCAFRVWAPHAEHVFITGAFNNWSKSATLLANEGNGYWSADVEGASPGDEYRYIICNGDQELYRNDPYAREVTSSIGNSVICDPHFDWGDDDFQMPNWNEIVIYEMHVGTFNKKPGEEHGDFYSAIEKLPYLRDLGINAIEIMPPMEFPGSFSWGYNPSHPFALESDYGGVKAFKELVKAAHAQGLAVFLDIVYNHFGPNDMDLWQFDGWNENGLGGIYFYNDWRAHTPWGDTRPDYGRDEVRQYLRDNALMWLEEYRVDGLRWDAVAYIHNVKGINDPSKDLPDGWSLTQWVHEEISRRLPWKLSVAEDFRGNPWILKSVGAGGAGFNALWDGVFVHKVRPALIITDDTARNTYAVSDAISQRYEDNAFNRVIFTESHDEVANGKARVPEEIWPGKVGNWFSKKRSTLGAALVFTSPGIPMIFQGQEFLEDRWFADKDPLDWSRLDTYSGLADMYSRMIFLRRNQEGNTRGLCGQYVQVHHINDDAKIIAFHRWDEGGPLDSTIVVVNLANLAYDGYNIGFPRPGLWKARFNSDWKGYDPSFANHLSIDTTANEGEKDGLPCNGDINIGPYSVVIYSQDE